MHYLSSKSHCHGFYTCEVMEGEFSPSPQAPEEKKKPDLDRIKEVAAFGPQRLLHNFGKLEFSHNFQLSSMFTRYDNSSRYDNFVNCCLSISRHIMMNFVRNTRTLKRVRVSTVKT